MSPLGKILLYVAVAGAIVSLVIGGLIVHQRSLDVAAVTKSEAEMITAQQQAKKSAAEAAALAQQNTDTTAKLTAASGMTAIARCIESLYSGRRNPVYSGIALHALRMLVSSLPRAIEVPRDVTARSQCLIASSMSAICANANVSAVHAIGHVVGGRYGLQHGIAHAILLAPSMRLLVPRIGPLQVPLLEALGRSGSGMSEDEAARAAADLVARLVAGLPLPRRLREVGVPQADIASLAEHAAQDPIMLAAAAPIAADGIADLLQAVW